MSKLAYQAKRFAEQKHEAQFRKYTGEPYSVHLREVAGLCAEVGMRDEVIAAAWLHDVVEDQGVLLGELFERFGGEVASLVEQVTDVSKPEHGTRAVRKALDREHLAGCDAEGATIKLADLMSNTSSIVKHDKDFARIYLAEKRLLLPLLSHGNKALFKRAEASLLKAEAELDAAFG